MSDVRAGVDALDRALIHLLAERQLYMSAAARLKPSRDRVHDAARIEQVVANVKAAAAREGVAESIVEPVWRLLVDRCIAFEMAEWDRLHGGAAS